ncbi:thioesterase [Streptomyces mashuensis]|uniref:Thioesterase n=1 Tax=Streptomyces mashuensis TaxID=33904 RepID=A0A919B9X0_9ACTN|nr:alpha/beta fold hydrolase [Streptomyces mashuensis]GHF69494.1 thioesterase [Streptomyces mashuensis]
MTSWFRTLTPDRAAGLRLYCFPHAGGSAGAFAPLAATLAGGSPAGPAVAVAAAQYPGRQDRYRERAWEDIGAIADVLAAEIRARDEAVPYALFGHSMGALIAYETARRLERLPGAGPARLFVSGRDAPTTGPLATDRVRDDEALLAHIRRLGGTGSRVLDEPELMAMALPALRADYAALSAYVWSPGEPLSCPLTVLVGDADPLVTGAGAAAWRRLSAAATDIRLLRGGHFCLDDCREEVASLVRDALPAPV